MTLGWFDGGDGDADLWRSEQRKHDYVYISAGWNEMEKRVPLMDGVLCVPPTLAILFSGGYLRFQGIHPHPDKVSISFPTHFTVAMVITRCSTLAATLDIELMKKVQHWMPDRTSCLDYLDLIPSLLVTRLMIL